ncbi:hypothetical protein [Microbacterium algeriense]|uniref:hypothetical protein n=1 Tax=Microbacterium algeriense TaxID=2615184 RepID=UPI0003620EF9|nr:hypothetical protein [Microbacterium barkeri]
MKMYSPFSMLFATIVVATVSLAGASAASASTDVLTESQETAIRAKMTSGGIASGTQDALIEKIEAGIAPDSLSGKAPVETVRERTATGVRTIDIFADGSRSWTEIQTASAKPTGPAPRSSISGCQNAGGWKVGCRVGIYDIISSATFVIDYQTSSRGQAKVRDMRSLTCDNVAGSCTRSGSIKRATQSSAGPAWAELSYSANAGWVTTKGAFGIQVSGTIVTTY